MSERAYNSEDTAPNTRNFLMLLGSAAALGVAAGVSYGVGHHLHIKHVGEQVTDPLAMLESEKQHASVRQLAAALLLNPEGATMNRLVKTIGPAIPLAFQFGSALLELERHDLVLQDKEPRRIVKFKPSGALIDGVALRAAESPRLVAQMSSLYASTHPGERASQAIVVATLVPYLSDATRAQYEARAATVVSEPTEA